MSDVFSVLVAVLTGISLSACTGFRAFLPPFLVGLFLRFGPETSPVVTAVMGLSFLKSTPVLLALGVAVVVEFLGDKIPWFDHVLDMIQAPVKMIIAWMMTYALLPANGDYAWIAFLLAMVLGGGTSLTVHVGKAGIRAGSTATTGGVANPVLSLLEEIVALVGTVIALALPVLALLGLMVLLFWAVRFLFGNRGGNELPFAATKPSYPFVRLVKLLLHLSLGLYNRLRIEGTEHLIPTGPMVVAANHASMLDGFLIGMSVPRPIYIMVKKQAFDNPLMAWFLLKCHAYPVDRERPDSAAIKKTLKVLADGGALALFPEGTRNFAGKIRPFKPGAIRFAVRQKAPIVPAYIANSHGLMPFGAWLPRPVRLHVKYGPALDVPGLLASGKTEQEIQDLLYERVCALGRELTGEDVRDFSAYPEDEPCAAGNGAAGRLAAHHPAEDPGPDPEV